MMTDEERIIQLEATVAMLERRIEQLRDEIKYLKRKVGKWPDKHA